MNQLQIFTNDIFKVSAKVEDGQILFDVEEVAKSLGFTTVARSGNTTVRWSRVNSYLPKNSPQVAKGDLIPEPLVYKLAFKASNEIAEQFQDWLAIEVIPSIRKHGAYMTDDVLEKTLHDPDYMIGLLTALKEEKQKRVEVEKTNNILMHVNKTYTATEIAKEIGFKSAIALNRDLSKKKIQFQQNGTWVFYSRYADKGYVEIKQDVLDNGKVIYHRRFTQMGREFLIKLYGLEQKEA
jgi:prophage antirepressor-like protein